MDINHTFSNHAGRTLSSKYKYRTMVEGNIVKRKKKLDAIQGLHSPDYILTKVLHKDGPPLGADFDCLPSGAFLQCKGILQVTSSGLFT